MLELLIDPEESYDEESNTFSNIGEPILLKLEHSLVSLSTWEARWHKPFLGNDKKTTEETIDYIKCMTLNDVPDDVYLRLSSDSISKILDYIKNPMSATKIRDTASGPRPKFSTGSAHTAEEIYWAMIVNAIPVEFQYWPLNRLLTLIKVCKIKREPPKKRNQNEILARQRELNEKRCAELNTKG